MTLPASGAISFLNLQNEFGGSDPISMNEYYSGSTCQTALPASGQISMSNFYGKTNIPFQNTPSLTYQYSGAGSYMRPLVGLLSLSLSCNFGSTGNVVIVSFSNAVNANYTTVQGASQSFTRALRLPGYNGGAGPRGSFEIWYKNGGPTGTGTLYIEDTNGTQDPNKNNVTAGIVVLSFPNPITELTHSNYSFTPPNPPNFSLNVPSRGFGITLGYSNYSSSNLFASPFVNLATMLADYGVNYFNFAQYNNSGCASSVTATYNIGSNSLYTYCFGASFR